MCLFRFYDFPRIESGLLRFIHEIKYNRMTDLFTNAFTAREIRLRLGFY